MAQHNLFKKIVVIIAILAILLTGVLPMFYAMN